MTDDDDDDEPGTPVDPPEEKDPVEAFGTVSGGTLTVTATDLSGLNDALKESSAPITSVDFSSDASIPAGVLEGTGVTSVTVPVSAAVNEYAFAGKTGLTITVTGSGEVNVGILGDAEQVHLILPAGTQVGRFNNSSDLSALTFQGDATLSEMSFYSCKNLTTVNGMENLTLIPDVAFYDTGLTEATLGAGVTVGQNAFTRSAVKTVNLRGDATLELSAFNTNALEKVNVAPGSSLTLGSTTFSSQIPHVLDLSQCSEVNITLTYGAFIPTADYTTKLYLPANTTVDLGKNVFVSESNVNLKAIYYQGNSAPVWAESGLPSDFTKISYEEFQTSGEKTGKYFVYGVPGDFNVDTAYPSSAAGASLTSLFGF